LKEVLHIFRKDVRHLWLSLTILLMVTIAHALFAVLSWPVSMPEFARLNGIDNLLSLLLTVGIWFLIAQVIFQEAIPGDRQFWLTRPYRRIDLLAAKVLFILVFISLPLMASDCYILGVQRFAVFGVVRELLLRQVFFAILFILPSLVLATVTNGLLQFVLGWFIVLLAFVSESMLASIWWGGATAIDFASGPLFASGLIAIGCGVVVWQYARRQTTAARLVLITTLLACWPAAWLVLRFMPVSAERLLPESPKGFDIGIGYDLGRSMPSSRTWKESPAGYALVQIPLTVGGLPANSLLRGNARVAMKVDGRAWPKGGTEWVGFVERIGGEYWQTLNLRRTEFEEIKQQAASWHAIFTLEVVSDEVETRMPLNRGEFVVPNVGLCRVFRGAFPDFRRELACRVGLTKTVESFVSLGTAADQTRISATSGIDSVPWGLTPTTQTVTLDFSNEDVTELAVIPRRKLAEFRRIIDVAGVRLGDYVSK
jgi:hypothetical protein